MNEKTKSLKLLIVDDEEDFLESSARALSRRGFDVHTAQDGATALALLARLDFDVVVLDLKMPGIDGEGVFDRIRADNPALPVIMLTGHGSVPHAFKTSKKGIADYIAKPCDMDELAGRIYQAVAVTKRQDEPAAGAAKVALASTIELLIVDDEVDFLSSMKDALGRRNMNVAVADSAGKALEHLEEAPVEVALVDVRLPGMDGLELLERIKESHPNVSVILLSGYPSAEAALKAVRLGASEYLSKPPDLENLVATIRRLYRQRDADIAEGRRKLIEEIRSRYPD
jgi:DNA-binding NtrC family response regulator